MQKYLKLRRVALSPEVLTAFEYNSDRYCSWAHVSELPNVTWHSEPMLTDDLVAVLRKRGWHPTDIGDEIDEARKYQSPKV